MNKICPECGKEINDNLNICQNCGNKLNNVQGEKKKKKMPVWVIILIVAACLLPVIVVLLIVLGVFAKFNIKENINISNSGIVLEGTSGYIEITYDEYEEKIDNNEHFVVVISREGCTYCELYKPVVEEVTDKYNIPIYYLDLYHMTKNEQIRLSTSNDYLMENSWGTPTTLYMHGEEVIDAIGGYVDEEGLEDFLDNYFVMN